MDSPLHYTILVPESQDQKFQTVLTEARAAGLDFEVTGIGIDVEDSEDEDDEDQEDEDEEDDEDFAPEGGLSSAMEMFFERRLLEELG